MVRALSPSDLDADAIIFCSPARAHPAQVLIAGIMGAVATLIALVVGSVLALVFAATLAVVLVLAGAVLALLTVTGQFNRPRSAEGPLIEARKVGHSWVAYGWDQPS